VIFKLFGVGYEKWSFVCVRNVKLLLAATGLLSARFLANWTVVIRDFIFIFILLFPSR
jgi:hypothetical protein